MTRCSLPCASLALVVALAGCTLGGDEAAAPDDAGVSEACAGGACTASFTTASFGGR